MPWQKHGWRIDKETCREHLPARPEPYWLTFGKGRALGFQKSSQLNGTWIARWTEPEGQEGPAVQPSYGMKWLGSVHDVSFRAAMDATQQYCKTCMRPCKIDKGGVARKVRRTARTVTEACLSYIANQCLVKGPETVKNIETQFEASIYTQPFGQVRLHDLQLLHVREWRDSLVTPTRNESAVNQIFRRFAAAMNYAKASGCIASARPWKAEGEFRVRYGRRSGYLTPIQRQALVAACDRVKDTCELATYSDLAWSTPDLGDLLRGLLFTGVLPGALVKAKVSDLDLSGPRLAFVSARNNKGEVRRRYVYLYEPAALEFFQRMAANKSPEEYLLTRRDGSAWVDSLGRPRYYQWCRGLRATIRDVNRHLEKADRIPEHTAAYIVHLTVIADMRSETDIEHSGMCASTDDTNCHDFIRDRFQVRLKERHSF